MSMPKDLEECCICLDILKVEDCFFYFTCKHTIHEKCSLTLEICPICRSQRITNPQDDIDIADVIELINSIDNVSVNNSLQNENQNQNENQTAETNTCVRNKFLIFKISLISFAAFTFFMFKYIV
jgi:hypothetical protein